MRAANDNKKWAYFRFVIYVAILLYVLSFWSCAKQAAFGEQLPKGLSGWYGYMSICIDFKGHVICQPGHLVSPYTNYQECKYWIDTMAEMVKADMHKSFPKDPMPTVFTKCVRENAA